jgi:hypothetical protein
LLLSGYQATMHDFSKQKRVRIVSGLQDMLSFVATIKA